MIPSHFQDSKAGPGNRAVGYKCLRDLSTVHLSSPKISHSNFTRLYLKMALPPLGASDLAVISRPYAQVINPSCLCSDGTGKGDDRPGYTKLTVDDDRMDAFRKALNEAFNNNTDLVTKYGQLRNLALSLSMYNIC